MSKNSGATPIIRISIFLMVFLALGVTVSMAPAAQDPPPATPPVVSEFSLTREISIPLENGKLDFGELLAAVTEELGFDGSTIRKHINWKFRPDTHMGQGPLMAIEAATNDVVTCKLMDDQIVIIYDRLQFHRESKRIRQQVRTYITRFFPAAAAAAAERFGFRIHADLEHQNIEPEQFDFERHLEEGRQFVILVHGLDDPGRIWKTARPILLNNGYIVCEFDYPNDQAIADSAELLAAELNSLRELGLTQASIVVHSMGGLVVREVLTNPEYYGGNSDRRGGDFPTIDKFIGIGVPNHGSQMARLHFTIEIRDQIVRTLSGDGMIFGGFFDGAGEAKIDLLPQSEFLHHLNARPLPKPVQMTIVAGIVSPVNEDKVEGILERFAPRDHRQGDSDQANEDLAESLKDLSNGFGDGCVSLKSTKLLGVMDHVTVKGNHLTMVRNRSYHNEDRVPPAIEIILARLAAPIDESDH